MNPNPRYLVDSDVLIRAKRQYYAFSICPGFWDALVKHHHLGAVRSVDRVYREIRRGKDDLTDWVDANLPTPSGFFLSVGEPEITENYGEIINWVNGGQFHDSAKAEFAAGADGWLAAYAKTHGGIVVTGEQFNSKAKNRVPLPNVCKRFGVRYSDVFQMLKDLKVRFLLK